MSNAIDAPIAANFPLTWQDPQEAMLFWQLDRMHWPAPITPMTGQYIDYMFLDGFNRACAAYELPICVQSRRINCYHYDCVRPLGQPPEVLAAQGQRAEQNLRTAMDQLEDQWQSRYRPELQEHLAYWEAYDLAAAPLAALLSHLDETITRIKRAYEIHFLLYFPFVLAPSLFQELYSELFGDEGALDAYQLLQGIDNKSLAADRALWQLSRRAGAIPAVEALLRQRPAAQIMLALAETAAAGVFLADLRAHLEQYGQRNDKANEPDAPHWIEDPTPVIERLQAYISQPDHDPAADLATQIAKREQAIAAARKRLQAYPQPVIDEFEALLKAAQAGVFLSEEHSYWIDQRVTYQARRVMLEFGRRLAAARALEQIDDIFFLTFDEVRATAENLPGQDKRRLVASRRAELAYFRTVEPPLTLGKPPAEPPPDDPLSRAISRFFGWDALPSPATPEALPGHAASAGLARGPAKVVRSLAEAGKLRQGDVLVAPMTQPAWTPLFATAAAVVTDTGGILSHCAIIAREYRIPAVVGLGTATEMIRDGQLLEVDGNQGLVRLVTSAGGDC